MGKEDVGAKESRAWGDPRDHGRGYPPVSGVLPLALEDATRALKPLIESDKEYVCYMKLHGDAPRDEILSILKSFEGQIYQRPPVKSSVRRIRRIRRIHRIDVLETEDRDVLFRARVDPGTYMRKLCVDVGYALGVEAHMEDLRRTKSGNFFEEDSCDLYDLYEAVEEMKRGEEGPIRKLVKPLEEALLVLRSVTVSDAVVPRICRGTQPRGGDLLSADAAIQPKELVVIQTKRGEAVALAKANAPAPEMPNSGFPLKLERVIMSPGTYPES